MTILCMHDDVDAALRCVARRPRYASGRVTAFHSVVPFVDVGVVVRSPGT